MNFDFSIAQKPNISTALSLKTVYVVNADPTYDVRKRGLVTRDLVVLRTIGGRGSIKIEGFDEIAVLPGTLLVFEHSMVRRYFCSDGTWDFWWFEFQTSSTLKLPMNRLLEIASADNETELCNLCLQLLRKTDSASYSLASAGLSFLMHKWSVNYDYDTDSNPHRISIEKVIEYVSENISRNITVKEMSEMTGLCERRFRQVFKKHVGEQPKKYFELLRIGMSEQLIKNTPFSIYEISCKLGYSSQFHFCKAFKRAHGISPSSFRAAIKTSM